MKSKALDRMKDLKVIGARSCESFESCEISEKVRVKAQESIYWGTKRVVKFTGRLFVSATFQSGNPSSMLSHLPTPVLLQRRAAQHIAGQGKTEQRQNSRICTHRTNTRPPRNQCKIFQHP